MKIEKLQVCVIVPNLPQAMERYKALLGIEKYAVYTVDTATLPGVTYRGLPANYKLRVAMGDFGAWMLELMEPLGGESIYREFTDRHGTGVHHIGLIVSDYEASMQKMLLLGFAHTQGGPIVGTDREGRFDYFDTEAALHTTIELLDMPTLPPAETITT